jgi:SAM-dependent methyltransferase
LSFGATYASIYDELYAEKDYAAESQFALDQILTIAPQAPMHILDLGCGTGLHAMQLAKAGISVTGVDRSADMVAIAEKRKELSSEELQRRLHFKISDIRTLDLNRRFDAVLSLFHVISYVIEDCDLERTFQIVRRHLDVGGTFLFDFWYGPAIRLDPPQQREKTVQTVEAVIHRKAVPEWDQERRVVCVNYYLEIKNVASGEITRGQEQHFVRYFSTNELESRLAISGFEVVRFGEWLAASPPSDRSLGAYIVAKAK